MKFNLEADLDVFISHWVFEVYNEKRVICGRKIDEYRPTPESAKRIWNVVQEVIIPPKKALTATETIWEDLLTSIACDKWGEQETDQVEDYGELDMDDYPMEASTKSPPSISEILIMLDEVKS
ncbi:hypothetical protein Salat_2123200 [Sesamum alatum]|uniref:Uncharacterized protein n=1 Tax=Sesamum alatum TaxID=300844 RepID=A0AAE1Y1V7_9LAMI|nr:hypothetical protein Salat_2123200 [Sesamum alatum]